MNIVIHSSRAYQHAKWVDLRYVNSKIKFSKMSIADKSDSLYRACSNGYKHLVLEIANQNNVRYVHPRFGDTPLHQACKQGWLDIVEILIEKYGCDPNVVTKSGESPLYYACRYGHINVVKLLFEKYNCDPNIVNKSNQSLLHHACQCGNFYIVKYLVNKQQLNLLMRDSINQSEPLDYAVNLPLLYTSASIYPQMRC